MKRHKSLIQLSRAHHHGLIAAQFCKKNSPAYKGIHSDNQGKWEYIITFGNNELINHFNLEEKQVIPVITGLNDELDKMSNQVLEDHKIIKQLIRELETTIDVESALDNFGKAVDRHIRFEEREWFEKIQNTVNEKLLAQIGERITGNSNREIN